MKSFIATVLFAAAMGVKIQQTTAGTAAPVDPVEAAIASLGACFDSHGNQDGKVQAGEVAGAIAHLA